MSENNKDIEINNGEAAVTENEQNMALDDGRRVKVLSPGMMVFKRFIRNRLAIVGICILVFMFLFSFLGGVISPYKQDQVFYKTDYVNKEYAGAVVNTEYRYTTVDNQELSALVRSKSGLLAQELQSKEQTSGNIEVDGKTYSISIISKDCYTIGSPKEIANVAMLGKMANLTALNGAEITEEFKAAAIKAVTAKQSEFEFEGATYSLILSKPKNYTVVSFEPIALASKLAYDIGDPKNAELVNSFDFRMASEMALLENQTEFEVNGTTYKMVIDDEKSAEIFNANDEAIASVSNTIVSPFNNDIFLSLEYKIAVKQAIAKLQENAERETTFIYNNNGTEEVHTVKVDLGSYKIYAPLKSLLIDIHAAPSANHLLGTDDHGMDVLTRLMYGGRISLMVGFVVVILEMLIGIVVGGISGYFGGWVDTLLMRFVDLFNSIPYYPMMIIAGSIMDAFEVNPYTRIFLLMGIMGIMGWTGIARTVRGQILSLREQDFMIATEATGIRVSRRIFRHLVPNVMPLLIVQATMSLGGIILTEATLSFLGLGIKYPLASWGTIINSASNMYVMQNVWYNWIPAGLLIVLTVLGFNFVGDGLRDAFDPKMKR